MTSHVVSALEARGFVLHPLNGKIPTISGWQKLTKTPVIIETHIEKGGNVGAVCGKASNITVIDLDSMLFASEVFKGVKIETLCSERTEGRGHVYYKYNPNLPSSKHHCLGIEVLSDGGNIVLPPSKHFKKIAGGKYVLSGDTYSWKNPDAQILEMPIIIQERLLKLFEVEAALKIQLSKSRHCFRNILKDYPDNIPDVHGAEGREYMIAICADLKANGATEEHARMFSKLLYQDKYNEKRTLQEWNNIDPRKTWTCDVLRAKLPAYVDLIECEKCDNRKDLFKTKREIVAKTIEHSQFTDEGNAKKMVEMFGDVIRYCHPWKSWLCWNGKFWERDNSGQIYRYAKETVQSNYVESEDIGGDLGEKQRKHALSSKSATKIRAMVFLAESEKGISILPDEFDKNKMLFNVQNGTIELEHITGQGKLREHNKEDYITRISPANYDILSPCDMWQRFVDDITRNDPDLMNYLQKMAGQLLCGEVRDKALYILHGKKDTGKTTFVETISYVLNEYSETMAIESLMKKSRGGIPNDIAALKGKRFVFVDEPDFGDKLSEGLVKKLTGLDTINARFLNEEFFKFKPEFKLWISCNNFPDITDKDQAIWGRVKKVPFLMKVKEIDTNLQEKLKIELSGILNWMIEGCLKWQKDGMIPPEIVLKATDDIKEDFDSLSDFFNICCIKGDEYKITHQYLFTAFQLWAMSVKRYPMSKKAFTQVCENRDLDRTDDIYINKKKYRGFKGITLTDWMITSVLRFLSEPDSEKEVLRTVITDVHVNSGRSQVDSHVCDKIMCSMRSNCTCIAKMCILPSVPSVPSVLLESTITGSNNQLKIEQITTLLRIKYEHFNKPENISDLQRLKKNMEGYILNEFENLEGINIMEIIDDFCISKWDIKPQVEKIKTIHDIISKIQAGTKTSVELTDIILKAQEAGLSKETIESMLSHLKTSGDIIEVSQNRFRSV